MPVPLYFDHNIDRQLADFPRLRGFDVITAVQDDATRLTDEAILARATELGRVIFTHNRLRFRRLHHEWGARTRAHAGILTAAMRRQDLLYGRLIAFLEHETPGTVANRLLALHHYDRFVDAAGQPA